MPARHSIAKLVLTLALCVLASQSGWATERYAASGLVVKVDRAARTILVSCDTIPGYMDAMVMPFSVRSSKDLENLQPGTMIDFTLFVDKKSSYAAEIKVRAFESFAQEPSQAKRLTLLQNIMDPAAPPMLAPGQAVPDFTLTDQNQRSVSLHDFAGKVIALNFVYTRCPLPDYCYRFSNNFGRLQKRFTGRLGNDLVLLTLTFDPVHDQPEKLAAYAQTWKANPDVWHFLTGRPDDVRRVCGWFGMEFWTDEALLTHTLHTVVIDRQGKLVTNIEGNQYSAEQLGDLVEATMDSARK